MNEVDLIYLSEKINKKDLLSIKDKRLVDNYQFVLNLKDPKIGLLLGVTFGFFGVDRFYKGDIILGSIKLIIALCVYIFGFYFYLDEEFIDASFFILIIFFVAIIIGIIWSFIDLFLVYKGIYKDNFNKVKCLLKDDD